MDEKFTSLIVADKGRLKDALRAYERFVLSGRQPLILTDQPLGKGYSAYHHRSLHYYYRRKEIKTSQGQLWRDQSDLFQQLAVRKTASGQALRDLTEYNGLSLWDLSARFVFAKLRPVLYDIAVVEAVLGAENPQEVYSVCGESRIGKIAGLVCAKKGISFQAGYLPRGKVLLRAKKAGGKFLLFLKSIKRFCFSLYFLAGNLFRSFRLNKSYPILFFAPIKRLFTAVLPVALKYENDERLVVDIMPGENFRSLRKHKIAYVDLHGSVIYPPFSFKNRAFLKNIKNQAFSDRDYLSGITYKGLSIGFLLEGLFERLIYDEFPDKIRYVDAVRKLILKFKPKLVVVADNTFEVSLIAKSLSVRVLGLQTAHAEEFIYYGMPAADLLAVDGNYWREFLSSFVVDREKIKVIGIPKFDTVRNNGFPQRDINLRGRFDRKKTVVYATNYPPPDIGVANYEWIEEIKSVCLAMKNLDRAHLIIKLHPYDAFSGVYRKIAREAGLRDYDIIRDIDILDLLRACDTVITLASRVSYEAVIMDKDAIVLSYSSQYYLEDAWDFKRYGAVLGVNELSTLESCMRKALWDAETISTLKKNREKYISEHAYKLDGGSSARAKELIDRFR